MGFFRSSGYFSIRPFLDNVPHIRILVGIDVDKITAKYQARGLLFQGDSQQTVNEFLNNLKQESVLIGILNPRIIAKPIAMSE